MHVMDIRLPDTAMCKASMELARRVSPPFLFNHVMRSYAFGKLAGEQRRFDLDDELLFIGSVLHDLGLVEKFTREERFEIDGADAAAEFLKDHDFPDKKIAVIWDAIAMHTTPSIPQRKRPEIALVQFGAGVDVGVIPVDLLGEELVAQTLEAYPRLGFKKAILEALAEIARRKPHAVAGTFVADVGRRHVEGFKVPDFCDAVHGAHFHE